MSKYYVFIFQFDTSSRGDWIGASQLHTKIEEIDDLGSYLYSLCDQYFGEYFDSERFDDFSDVGKDYAYFDNEFFLGQDTLICYKDGSAIKSSSKKNDEENSKEEEPTNE